jgi:protein-S-isoprenylcysteine O-methyltransferase Ste14
VNILAIRSAAVLFPLCVAGAAWLYAQPRARTAGAVHLATLWTLPSLLAVHLVARAFGWWSFAFDGGGVLGFPVDLFLGWALLWGAIPVLLFRRLPLLLTIAIMIAIDLAFMPLCAPVVRLGDRWLIGELVAAAVVLVPAQLLARWTDRDTHLGARALLQFLLFTALLVFFLPTIALTVAGQSWRTPVFPRVALQCALVAGILGATAVQEFAERGGGTPFPFDPPKRLVRGGIYAYLRNPMQLSATLLFLVLAATERSTALALAAAVCVAFSAGFAAWDERTELAARFTGEWTSYAGAVRNWIPSWRPRIDEPSTIYFAAQCDACSEMAGWIRALRPRGLLFVPAELHPEDLQRVRYERADGTYEEGLAAVARALEHVHLGWAVLGFSARLPLARTILQLILDAVGGGKRSARPAMT